MKLPVLFFAALLALGLAGCESATMSEAAREANIDATAQGLPFRWQVRDGALSRILLPLPSAPSRADAGLQRAIFARIAETEASDGRGQPQLADIKRMRDSREVWVLQTAGPEGIFYLIFLRPVLGGGFDPVISEAIVYTK